jgi:ABC-type cobalamin transport system permease subunit
LPFSVPFAAARNDDRMIFRSRRQRLVAVTLAGIVLAVVGFYVSNNAGQPTQDRALTRAALGAGVALLGLVLLIIDMVRERRRSSH